MHDRDLPEAEKAFVKLIENRYLKLGLSKDSPLFHFYVEVSGPQGYVAGRRIAREISSLTSLKGKTVLDVGCNVGGGIVVLSELGAECVGIDLNKDDLSICRQRLNMHKLNADILCADGYQMPFNKEQFDVVICTEVLEHVKDRKTMIREMSRVLKKGGLLYLSFPNLLSLRNLFSDPHYKLFGVTFMPLSLAAWYTRKRRGSNYDVEILPIPASIASICATNGIKVYAINASEEVLLSKIDAPESINKGMVRTIASIVKALGLRSLLKLAVKIRSNTLPSGVLVGFKG
jgi:ubiquinone/menaquinone biosynthesis C-methylase UbiE